MRRSGEIVIPFVLDKRAVVDKQLVVIMQAPLRSIRVSSQSIDAKGEKIDLRIPLHAEGPVVPSGSKDIQDKTKKMTRTFLPTLSQVGKHIRSDDPAVPDEQDDG